MEARRFPEPEVEGSIPSAGDLLTAVDTWALSSVEERPFRIREVEGSNPSVSTLFVCGQTIAAGLEPATVGSEVQRSSIQPRDRSRKVVRVGFEPTPPKRLRPERSALDHSATSPLRCSRLITTCGYVAQW